MTIAADRIHSRFEMSGKTALFTSISDLTRDEIIDLYKKGKKLKHCFRTISMHDLMAPEYR
ncbi:MAG: hypothetical protein M1113_01910 [Candidatus Thermoplasmatota archaeon]|nr:hypothetical protein [Candidatus Thermoplasmatota archaeon]